jgi:hypothetical protein
MKIARGIMVSVVLLAALAFCTSESGRTKVVAADEPSSVVDTLLKRTERAQTAWVNGDSRPYEELFAHDKELTFTPPFGGEPLQGWETIGIRMSRAAKAFQRGTCQLELVHATITKEIVCLVMVERNEVTFAGHDNPRKWVLRVTQIYRLDGDEWRVIHRHADPLIDRRSLDEILALLSK